MCPKVRTDANRCCYFNSFPAFVPVKSVDIGLFIHLRSRTQDVFGFPDFLMIFLVLFAAVRCPAVSESLPRQFLHQAVEHAGSASTPRHRRPTTSRWTLRPTGNTDRNAFGCTLWVFFSVGMVICGYVNTWHLSSLHASPL